MPTRKILFNNNPMPPAVWPVSWVGPATETTPAITHYRLVFQVEKKSTVILHVSADEHYRLYLDDQLIGRGSDSGSLSHWYFDSWQLEVSPGEHELTAKVTCWGIGSERGSQGRISMRPAFVLAASDKWMERLGTGLADWSYFIEPLEMTGSKAVIHCCYSHSLEKNWQPVRILYPAKSKAEGEAYGIQPLLTPSIQPEMFHGDVYPQTAAFSYDCDDTVITKGEIPEDWKKIKDIEIQPHQTFRVLLTFDNYVCAYSKLYLSGGKNAEIRLKWAEAAFDKSRRDQIYGKTFDGIGDSYISNGAPNQCFEPIYWNSGRLVELTIRNGNETLVLHQINFTETHYPIIEESCFKCSDTSFETIIPLLLRTLKMCIHDVFMDCPYYERLMYVGDSRIEALTLLTVTSDDRPIRNALTMFAESRYHNGLVLARFPSLWAQNIPPYALWFVNMLHDYAMWRDNQALIHELLPRCRESMSVFEKYIDSDGLLHRPPGWNFIDWVEEWNRGVPKVADDQICGILNWQYILALTDMMKLERRYGQSLFSAYYQGLAEKCFQAMIKKFWDKDRKMFADDTGHCFYSEHSQCLAVISGYLSKDQLRQIGQALKTSKNLVRTTVYFSHYLFEAAYHLNQKELFYPRLDYWFKLPEQGFKTVPERPEPSRSDCHAWGTHPYYHFFATILGIRPADYGFEKVEIAPMPGSLTHVSGRMPHPKGFIKLELIQINNNMEISVELPEGISGIFRYQEHCFTLHEGKQDISMKLSVNQATDNDR